MFTPTKQELEWLVMLWAQKLQYCDPHQFVQTPDSFKVIEEAHERLTALAECIGKERVDELVDKVNECF